MKNFFIILFLFFYSCSLNTFENFLGKPKNILKNLSEVDGYFRTIESDIKPSDVLVKLKDFLYQKDADIYFISDTEIYVRNLIKIYKRVSNTTDLYIVCDKKGEGSIIKFTSFNIELIEYLVDNFNILTVDGNKGEN